MSIVQTNVNYNSLLLRQNLSILNRTYPFLNIQIIGKSVLKDNIYAIKLGRGNKEVLYSASIHANEWITSLILMKFIEDYCIAYTNNSSLYNYSVRDIFNNTSIYIIPMVNPDGVNLVTNYIRKESFAYINAKNISNQFPNIPFPNRVESKY